MIEFSVGELILLLWAVAATGTAFHFREQNNVARFMLRKIIEDEQTRESIVDEFKKFKAKTQG